ncbi:MATE family efflux transporter [Vibrio lamellibrachiae]|uniref:MATE family efflux transporter n=1 Tax=Vibrio lamellibrachiae TaxID=2910253 RepID=UPI003D0CCF18
MSTSYLAEQKNRWFDKALLVSILSIAIPVTLQTILFSSKGLIDLIMIGQLSEQDIAAVGVAGRALFVATILLSGVTTGGAMLAAQYFGAKDYLGVTRSIALSWMMASVAALIPLSLFWLVGDFIIGLSSSLELVQQLGHEYLQITGLSLFCVAFSGSIAAGLRSAHQASTSTWLSGIGVGLNIFLNWVLIFGHFGTPALGLKGAAIATVISSVLEVLITIAYLRYRKHILCFGIKDLKAALCSKRIRQFTKLAFPTTVNFLLWSAGLFAYTAIMGRSGEQGLVVFAVITPIEAFSLSFLVGIANASSVIVGNQLGANKPEAAYSLAIQFTIIAFFVTVAVSLGLYLCKDLILGMFGALEEDTRQLADKFYSILCIGIILRSLPTTMVVGVLRAGGDVKFCLYQDLFTQWLFGIPLAAIGALVLGFTPDIVFAMFFLETIFKWFACIYRFRSKKWINCLAD